MVRFATDTWVIVGMIFFSCAPVGREAAAAQRSGSGEAIVSEAFDVTFGLTQIYQHNVRGGRSTSERDGRYAGSYDLCSTVDLDALAGLDHTESYFLIEGGWPDVGGTDPKAVGSFFGVNGDAIEGQWTRLSEWWIERSFHDRALFVRVGKIDLTGGFQCRHCETAFDGSLYAHDETTQFLNSALVNNATIPFPDLTVGLAFMASPVERWHIGLALATREGEHADDETISWGSVDNGLFAILEGSFIDDPTAQGGVLGGEYRAGLWCQTAPTGVVSDSVQAGVYFSISQPLIRRCVGPDHEGGLGLFARGGWTDGEAAELESFWSVGLAYEGLLWTDDVLAVGLADGHFVGGSDPDVPRGNETAVELYYNAPLTEWAHLSPSIQYVADPGGAAGGDDALILGLRLQMLIE